MGTFEMIDLDSVTEMEHGYVRIEIGFHTFFVRPANDLATGQTFYDLYDANKKHLDEIWCGGSIDFNMELEELKGEICFEILIKEILERT